MIIEAQLNSTRDYYNTEMRRKMFAKKYIEEVYISLNTSPPIAIFAGKKEDRGFHCKGPELRGQL